MKWRLVFRSQYYWTELFEMFAHAWMLGPLPMVVRMKQWDNDDSEDDDEGFEFVDDEDNYYDGDD